MTSILLHSARPSSSSTSSTSSTSPLSSMLSTSRQYPRAFHFIMILTATVIVALCLSSQFTFSSHVQTTSISFPNKGKGITTKSHIRHHPALTERTNDSVRSHQHSQLPTRTTTITSTSKTNSTMTTILSTDGFGKNKNQQQHIRSLSIPLDDEETTTHQHGYKAGIDLTRDGGNEEAEKNNESAATSVQEEKGSQSSTDPHVNLNVFNASDNSTSSSTTNGDENDNNDMNTTTITRIRPKNDDKTDIQPQQEVMNHGLPRLRTWDLTSNSTRLDRMMAAPSDKTLVVMWSIWVPLLWMVSLFTLIVFLSISRSKRCRKNPFNVYLLFLMIPDFTFSLLCGATCLSNAVHGYYWTPGHDNNMMCNFQQWYVLFGLGANNWLNAAIARQLHLMLTSSARLQRYHPPTRRTVVLQSLVIYVYSAFMATWGLTYGPTTTREGPLNTWGPVMSGSANGMYCRPLEGDTVAEISIYWSVFLPLAFGVPLFYVPYVGYDIYAKNLLPPVGKRRALAVYFGRLLLVFMIMWIPTFASTLILGPVLTPWGQWAFATWAHLQGAVSAGVSLMKDDIRMAVGDFFNQIFLCRRQKTGTEGATEREEPQENQNGGNCTGTTGGPDDRTTGHHGGRNDHVDGGGSGSIVTIFPSSCSISVQDDNSIGLCDFDLSTRSNDTKTEVDRTNHEKLLQQLDDRPLGCTPSPRTPTSIGDGVLPSPPSVLPTLFEVSVSRSFDVLPPELEEVDHNSAE